MCEASKSPPRAPPASGSPPSRVARSWAGRRDQRSEQCSDQARRAGRAAPCGATSQQPRLRCVCGAARRCRETSVVGVTIGIAHSRRISVSRRILGIIVNSTFVTRLFPRYESCISAEPSQCRTGPAGHTRHVVRSGPSSHRATPRATAPSYSIALSHALQLKTKQAHGTPPRAHPHMPQLMRTSRERLPPVAFPTRCAASATVNAAAASVAAPTRPQGPRGLWAHCALAQWI